MAKATGKGNAKEENVADIMKKVGKRIRALRMAQGHTSHETFAYENDINRAQYSRYERGEDLRLTTLIKVLQGFDITLGEFFGEGFE
jgi:transcriptional regulator with XRE-family HTH domain